MAEKKNDEATSLKTSLDQNEKQGTVYVCTEDCFLKGVRYRTGEEISGTACPPHFAVKAAVKEVK